MKTLVDELDGWMQGRENEHLEFKEAKNNFHFDTLVKYCAALANEGGGRILLGVTDKQPRRVVGSRVFENLERTKAGLVERLHIRVDAEEIKHPEGRVLVFEVPARPIGTAIQYAGAYWMRAGEDLVPMTPDQLKRIFDEGVADYSALVCPGAGLSDLEPAAIAELRTLWRRKSGNGAIETVSDEQLLHDAELLFDEGVTYAALILLGSSRALGRFLAQAEVVFEYRSVEASVEHQARREFREGFLLFKDVLWEEFNRRNDVQHIQEGLFIRDVPTFNEGVIREAILNAVSHRDYRLPGSVFIRQSPRRAELTSPGGFPPGISEANILYRQLPRNRRVAEVLTKCGLVERSGQGVDKMFRESILEGKPRPEYRGTDDYQVVLNVYGDIQSPRFLQFMEEVGREQAAAFSIKDLQVLEFAYQGQTIPDEFREGVPRLVEGGVLERVGRGRGTRYILSRRFYEYLDEKGAYTRKRGLDRETNKALLLRHIRDNRRDGSRFEDLKEVLPMLTRAQVQTLLQELKQEEKIHVEGVTKGARWYPAAEA